MAQTSNQVQLDWDLYVQNRGKWTLEQLALYSGQWVAWSLDGTSIIAHHVNLTQAVRAAKEAGFGPREVLMDYLAGPDEPDTI